MSKSRSRFLLTLLSDNPRAAACVSDERFGDRSYTRHFFRDCYGPRSSRRFLLQLLLPEREQFFYLEQLESNAKCSLSCNHRTTLMNTLIHNKCTMLTVPRRCDYCKSHAYR
ncbi:hypothetical protein TNIN_420911 [Trichonephila inaurata madagascariensis]|uniref:Uncharacterized protein n=1 Tax=Trichonephila inaurata madagascariensis TaxID=2747483 RepID=A0A8X6YR60_9ARAC|nr:hypothetical protein TNIN_420911 [Trichonephila inaurata madagascariensis]